MLAEKIDTTVDQNYTQDILPAWIAPHSEFTSKVLDRTQMLEFLHALKFNLSQDLSPYIIFSDRMYARNRIFRNDFIDILIMCWRSNQFTPIHDHKNSVCGVRIVIGTAAEIQYEKSNSGTLYPTKFCSYVSNSIMASQDEDTHQVGNLQKSEDLITLHAYSPPLKNIDIYSLENTIYKTHEQTLSGLRKQFEQN